MDDIDRAVDDPALASLVASGWSVICPIAMEERGEVYVTLILAPPSKANSKKSFALASVTAIATGIVMLLLSGTAI